MIRKSAALLLLGVLFLLMSIFPANVTRAQDNLVSLAFEAAYGGYFRSGQWIPLWISVTNNGPNISGELRVMSPDISDPTAYVYATPIELPTQSSKQVFLYIPLGEMTRQLRVELATPDRIVASDTHSLKPLRDVDMLFTVITESPRGGIDLKAIHSGLGDTYQADWRLDNIPRLGTALRGLDALVLTDVNTGNLAIEQREALEDWVLAGGHLVVSGGPDWQKTQAGVTGLLPLLPDSTTTLVSFPAIARFAGRPDDTLEAPSGSPIIVAQGQLSPDAQVLVSESGVPLVVRRPLGSGFVDYLAFDPGYEPFLSWVNRGQFWFALMSTPGARPSWTSGITDTRQASIAADYIKGLRLPDVLQLAIFLMVYITLVGPVNYFVLRAMGRRELAWITIPLIVIGVSVIYYLTGFSLRGTQAVINRLTVVQVWPGSQRAQVDGVVGVLTPRRAVFDLELGQGFTLRALGADQLGGLGNSFNGTIYEGSTYEARQFPVDSGTTAAFTTSGYITARSVQGEGSLLFPEGIPPSNGSLTSQNPRITGVVQNTTDLTLQNAVVLAKGGSAEIGTLSPGETRQFQIVMDTSTSSPVALGGTTWSTNYALPGARAPGVRSDMTIRQIMGTSYEALQAMSGGRGFEDTPERQEMWRRQSFMRSFITDTDPSGGRGTDIYVAGWTNDSPVEVNLRGLPASTEDTTLYIYRLPGKLSPSLQDKVVEVPSAFLTWTPTDRSSRRDFTPYSLRIQPGDSLVLRYTPVPLVRLSDVDEIWLEMQVANTYNANRGKVSIWDWQALQWVTLNPTATVTRITDNPGRFVGPGNAVDLQFEPGDSPTIVYYDRIDVTLYGHLSH